jgi:hypothetical protein
MRCSHIINASGQHNLRCSDIAATKGIESNRAAPRRHGCTETPEPPFSNKAVISSTLCVWIVVSAPFLRWPGTDRPSQHRTELHNTSVDEASKLEKTKNKLFGALHKISASFSRVSAAVLRLPDTDRPERRHQTACLSPFLCVTSRCFSANISQAHI